ncbi:Pyruvate carboxyltransferase [Gossypium australe]|uniref:Pyruvate carboxyltransferase n=1 Tax=Gossypium australe TaxID=47621 RepID=A0A5B6WGE4_9ROSI|nr:Pyruvate carboxyltransferase [Gossypium australe]
MKFRLNIDWCLEASENLPLKLERLGQKLLTWSHTIRRDRKARKKKFEDRMKELYAKDLDDDIFAELTKIQLELNLDADKEIFWEQRARINWLYNGDQNTTFFHKMVTKRK